MIDTVEAMVRRGRRRLLAFFLDPRVRMYIRGLGWFFAGLVLSAASLANVALPLSMALVYAAGGGAAVLAALGGSAGYLLFWGKAGLQGVAWCVFGLGATLIFKNRRVERETPLLLPAVAGLTVSGMGVLFQTWLMDGTPVAVYLLRVCLGLGTTWLFCRVTESRHPIRDWLACGLGVLALAQIAPFPWLSLGVVAGGALAVRGAFPMAALAGVALDLSGVCPVPMTAVLCAGYLIRFLPGYPKKLACLFPFLCCLFVMAVTGQFSLLPLPALAVGGIVGGLIPMATPVPSRRGETGVAQVRLEMAAGALLQSQQLLLEVQQPPVDEDALVTRAAERACNGCPCRRGCKDSHRLQQLTGLLLHKPLLAVEELPICCRKSGRLLAELHRGQEQLRSIRADRQRQQEYRSAVIQQYRFLGEYLQDLSDQLAQRTDSTVQQFSPRVAIYANRPESENGDRVLSFAGVGCRYYVILCDGMGTGSGAVQEAKSAQKLLRRLLTAGYPAEHALRSLNSLCALRSRAGAVTVELLELQLDTGRGRLYKWGAVPSYLISAAGTEKIGTAGPPPGLSVEDNRDVAYQLSLRRGETLVLVSDGVGEEEALHCCLNMGALSPGELAKSLLTCTAFGEEDDATVVLVHLDPGYAST
ncbi:MAG: SpoIIE family protein phosphatase [Oscillospiraceae bacterium]|nr:SpoIIE family protein phosphatase [Oscillospiraceae bacterium]